ncbi:spz4 family protein [Megaselia abdita]
MKRMYGEVRHISILRDEMDLKNEINAEDIVDTQERYLRDSRKSKYLHADYQGLRNNDVLMEPHFRPVSTTTTSTSTTTTTPKPSQTNNQLVGTKKLDDVGLDETEELKEENEDNNELDNNTYYDVVAENIKVVKSPQLDQPNDTKSSETATISTTLKIVQQKIEAVNNATMKTTTTTAQTSPVTVNTTTTTTEPVLKTTEIKGKPVLMEGQLFQDTVQKEPVIGPNMKGVNACPVKEEVVAPFWANNTRGEILALLNLYPFEQYVHWEKCTNEFKQMYCRDGCRCEQQYSLHRLLAYDPHNECRGIFSDWFRFPSGCICKCYNIPYEFRATSRSPRSDEPKHAIDVAESEVRKAIYDHATEDWYRKKDDFYDFD